MSHTPTPWRVHQNQATIAVVGGNDIKVCSIRKSVVDHLNGRPMSDASLIAAAPQLLAALKAYVDYDTELSTHGERDLGHEYRLMEQGRAAIGDL